MDTEPAKRILRYAVAHVCFILVAVASGWLLYRIYDDLGFAVLVLSGSVRTRNVVLQCLALPFILLWLVGVLRAEASFRSSVGPGRGAGPALGSGAQPAKQQKIGLTGLLERLGLGTLLRRVLFVAGVLLCLLLLDLLISQLPYLS